MDIFLRKELAIGVLAILLVVAGAFFFFGKGDGIVPQEPAGQIQGEEIDLSVISTTTQAGGYTIEPVPVEQVSVPAPDYKTSISFDTSVPADVRIAIQAQQAEVITILSSEPASIDAWLRFATLNKIAGDRGRSIETLIYVTKVWPKDPAAYAGLGDAYRTQGKLTQARVSYTTAVSLAEAAGQKDLANTYRTELNAL